MKKLFIYVMLFCTMATLFSCEKDEGKLPNISFKSGGTYTSANQSITGGTVISMGINASKAEDKDVLKKINISKSINGAASSTLFDADLSGADGDSYSKDISETLETVVGQTNKYTFTVTNRDGLTNQVSLTVTIQ